MTKELIVPALERDDSNRDDVMLGIAALLTGGDVTLQHLHIRMSYRLPSGEVRFLDTGYGEEPTS